MAKDKKKERRDRDDEECTAELKRRLPRDRVHPQVANTHKPPPKKKDSE